MIGRYSAERVAKEISKMPAEEFLGVCKILGVSLIEDEEARNFSEIWADVVEKINRLDRNRRKNLMKLLRAANKDR